MTARYELRRAGPDDHRALGEIMYEAVHDARSLYSEAQRHAWMPHVRQGPDWDARLAGQLILLAQTGVEPAGFLSLAPPDYVDFAYIRPRHQGRGLFRQLYDAIEAHARSGGATRLGVHASLMARPAFEAVGFTVVRAESVTLRDVRLDRFEMTKPLT